ncbi:MAG: hypothetical protein WB783_03600 [Arenicellales bacterium]
MNKRNVWVGSNEKLESHVDDRGRIADVFYRRNVNHVALIESRGGAVRGNHYHKATIQHVLITKGSLEYWYKSVGSHGAAKCEVLGVADVVSTPPNEIHAMRMLEDTQFIVFSEGNRGGKDYESDTFRVSVSIIPEQPKHGGDQNEVADSDEDDDSE